MIYDYKTIGLIHRRSAHPLVIYHIPFLCQIGNCYFEIVEANEKVSCFFTNQVVGIGARRGILFCSYGNTTPIKKVTLTRLFFVRS